MSDTNALLDTLAMMTASSLEICELEPRELMLTRIAALAAVDAPAVSYLANARTATDAGLTLEDVEGILVAIAPIVGSARVVSAAGNIALALGLVVAAIDAELETQLVGG